MILILLGLLTRLVALWYPNEVVFDEVHFGKFVSAYYRGEYYFDIHPPLGKLLIAGFAKFFGFRAGFDFDQIGEGYGDIPYAALRFLPNLAGAFVPAALFEWLSVLGISRPAAFLAGLLLVFDNAMLVQSHFILVDAFLLLFGFGGLWLFFSARSRGYRWHEAAFAAFVLALSFSVKWTGLAFFGVALGAMVWDAVGLSVLRRAPRTGTPAGEIARGQACCSTARPQPQFLRGIFRTVTFLGIAAAVYLAVFWIHFALLPNAGPGNAFMSSDFPEKSFVAKTAELNRVMYTANKNLRAPHAYGSPAWTWPLMARPVFYWVRDFADGTTARIYFLGNPAVWWFSTFGLAAALFLWRPKLHAKKWILYSGWLISMIPFFFIKRVIFLYHYLPALGFAVAILSAWLFDEGRISMAKRIIWGVILVAAIAGFWFFAPLSYGLPLTESQYTLRVWQDSWR